MRAYTIELSEDGLVNEVYTNIKALYNGIISCNYSFVSVGSFEKSRNFNYTNLAKAIKESTKDGEFYALCWCFDENNYTKITIREMRIKK